MAIDWRMAVSDPMQGVNTGLANIGQALQYQQQQERLRPQTELQQLQVDKERQSAADNAGLRTNLANLQPTVSGGYTDATGQEVPQTSTPANTTKAAYDYWSQRDPVKAEAIADGVFTRAQHLATATGDHAGAVDLINSKLGFNLKYTGTKGNIINLKNGDGSELAYDLTSGKVVASGAPKPKPQGKIIDKTVDLGDKVIIQYTDGTEKTMPKAAKPDTVIRVGQGGGNGKAPAGYRYTATGDMEAIPGGPADVKAETKRQSVENGKAAIDATDATIDKLLNHPGRKAATGFSSLNPINKIPGTDASDFNKELESFDSKLFLSNIQAMKGMGALSNAEGAKVSAAAGAIKAGMSEKAFVSNMNTIKQELAKAKARMDSGNMIPSRPQAPQGKGIKTKSDPLGIL